jgi:hypothetical protein
MINLECKKLLILRILNILERYSDYNHPLKYSDILDYLRKDYGVECERKAVARNILFLKEGGYSVASTRKGVYIESRMFEESELRLLIDSVLMSRYVNEKHSKEIIDKLKKMGLEAIKIVDEGSNI